MSAPTAPPTAAWGRWPSSRPLRSEIDENVVYTEILTHPAVPLGPAGASGDRCPYRDPISPPANGQGRCFDSAPCFMLHASLVTSFASRFTCTFAGAALGTQRTGVAVLSERARGRKVT